MVTSAVRGQNRQRSANGSDQRELLWADALFVRTYMRLPFDVAHRRLNSLAPRTLGAAEPDDSRRYPDIARREKGRNVTGG
jgi:hypothetical protein